MLYDLTTPRKNGSEFMLKLKSILVLSATAVLLSTTPSFAQYGSGTEAAKDVATDAAKDVAKKKAKDTAYGSGTDAAEKVKDKAYGSGEHKADEVKDKAYGSDTKASTKVQEKAYGSDTKAAAPAQPAYNSGTTALPPANCPAGTKAQPNGTCMLVDSSKFNF